MLDAATELDHAGQGAQTSASTTLSESTHALHIACHAAQPHRTRRADSDAEMHVAFEGVLEGGTFDTYRMHFSHSLMRQGFAAAVQTQGSDDMQDVAWFFNMLGKHFKVKEPVYLHKDAMIDHLEVVIRIVRYAGQTKDLCLFQPWGSDGVSWRFYSNSDQSGNREEGNKYRSQLSHIAMHGRASIVFGRKSTSVQLGPDLGSL